MLLINSTFEVITRAHGLFKLVGRNPSGVANRLQTSSICPVVAVLALLFCVSASACLAEKTGQEFIPPDVTLSDPQAPSQNTSAPAATPAPQDVSGQGSSFFRPTGWPFGSLPAQGGQAAPASGVAGAVGTSTAGTTSGATTSPGVGPPGSRASSLGGVLNLGGDNATVREGKDPVAILQTNKGTITLRLFRKYAPKTVAHFSAIAQTGFYNGLTFHRYVPGQLVQGGCPNGNGSGFYIDKATGQPKFSVLETSANLKHNAAGVVGLARFGKSPLSASCQFYITLSSQPALDGMYSIFAGVVGGMDVVEQLRPGDKILSLQVQEQE